MWSDPSTKDSQGVWLWAVFSTVTLFFLEFVLFAAFIPTDWSKSVEDTELRWLVASQGATSANAILDQAARWCQTLFIDSGIEPWTYEIFAPGPGIDPGKGFEKFADNALWPWMRGRLDVIWGSFAQALQRIALLWSWWPFLAVLVLAAAADGGVRRRIRQHGFIYTSPLAHRIAVLGLLFLWIIVGLLLLAPLPWPAAAIPLLCVVTAVLVGLGVTNTQKRL